MAHYPLMFTFRDAVSGNGYLAGVTLSGRALMVKEEDGKWWAYGVRPGALAAFGETPQEAYHNFRTRYTAVLFDLANESQDFDSFKQEVERFYSQPDNEEESRWTSAFLAIRNGEVDVEEPFAQLPKEAPETRPSSISVIPLHKVARYTATDNIPDTFVLAEAA